MRLTPSVLTAALLLTGCSGGADAGDPDFRDELVSFSVPDGFDRTEPGQELIDGLEVEFLAEPASPEVPVPEQINLRYGVPDDDQVSLQAYPLFMFGASGDGQRIEEGDFVEVDGSEQAYRFAVEQDVEELGTARFDVLAAVVETGQGPRVATLTYAALLDDFDDGAADATLDTLRVDG